MSYNWQQKDWAKFSYSLAGIEDLLFKFSEKMGRVDGLLAALPESQQTETILDVMVSEAIKTSEIEGELLSRPDVMSSIKYNLGLSPQAIQAKDQRVAGIAELMVTLRNHYSEPLTQDMLFTWHDMLMKGSPRIKSGAWRRHDEPMLIVSGTLGDEEIHFEAPPSIAVPAEMSHFIQWFNDSALGGKIEIPSAVVRSAIAHLYFESIHPFEDGNGRVGRALSEKALSQGIGRPILLSLSQSIQQDRANYYAALKEAQRSNEISPWIHWFAKTLLHAQEHAERRIEFTLKKATLFDRIEDEVNDRQLKVIRRMLKEGPDGFKGGLTAKKYMAIAKTTKASATRDLQALVKMKVLVLEGGGRSTHYQVTF